MDYVDFLLNELFQSTCVFENYADNCPIIHESDKKDIIKIGGIVCDYSIMPNTRYTIIKSIKQHEVKCDSQMRMH